jgi:hypothetical protein
LNAKQKISRKDAKGEEKEDKIHHRDAEGTKTDIFFTEGNEGNEGIRGQRVTKEAKN